VSSDPERRRSDPSTNVSDTAVQELPRDQRAPRQARELVRRWLPQHGFEHLMDDAVLLASELVANAVAHATHGSVRLALSRPGQVMRCEVSNRGVGAPLASRVPTEALSGRGLFLVDALASRWGSAGADGSTLVWFELDG
jgi:anti-sigma regulatory factor (Ser/Thr protein kinase)